MCYIVSLKPHAALVTQSRRSYNGGALMYTVREEALIQIITEKLNNNCITCGQTIEVIVTGNDITLVGWCDSEEQRKAAELIVLGTCGIRGVIDNIRVRRLAQLI